LRKRLEWTTWLLWLLVQHAERLQRSRLHAGELTRSQTQAGGHTGHPPLVNGRAGVDLPAGVWFPEDVREMTIFAEQYDFVVTLLMLEDRDHFVPIASDAEEDVYDRFTARS
jgi:hypothetical protein